MTRQIKDILIYEGERLAIDQYLLEDYFNEFPDQRPRSDVFFLALWRKYVVTSEIVNNQFVVRSIKVRSPAEAMAFEDWKGDFPLNKKFDWFSGLIRIDSNRLSDWKEESKMFKYLEVYRGDLLDVKSFSLEELETFKDEQFVRFKKSKTYETAYKELAETTTSWAIHKVDDLIRGVLLKRYSRTLVEAAFTNQN